MTSRQPSRLFRLPQVLELVPVSRSAWYAGIKLGKYPAPLKLGPRTSCWLEDDIVALVASVRSAKAA